MFLINKGSRLGFESALLNKESRSSFKCALLNIRCFLICGILQDSVFWVKLIHQQDNPDFQKSIIVLILIILQAIVLAVCVFDDSLAQRVIWIGRRAHDQGRALVGLNIPQCYHRKMKWTLDVKAYAQSMSSWRRFRRWRCRCRFLCARM